MSWIYQGIEFTDEMIPEGAVGFIYEMTAFIDGKLTKYIGKKNFYKKTNKKLTKKELLNHDKRKKTYTTTYKPDYQNYYSSNEVLKNFHKSGGVIKREILSICFSKIELTYQETKHQFLCEVLERDYYLNRNILGRFFRSK